MNLGGELLSEVNWQLILFTVLLSALVAFFGDILGMRIAKKRISLLGLRPRYTSRVITALTGMVIAMGIIAALAVTSDTVRTAIFSLKYVQRQILALTEELQESRDESELMGLRYVESLQKLEDKEQQLSSLTPELDKTKKELQNLRDQKKGVLEELQTLRNDAANLRRGLEAAREGQVVAFSGELLAQETVLEGASRQDVMDIMARLRDKVRYVIARRASISPQEISVAKDEVGESQIVSRCTVIDSRKVIRVRAAANAVAGEPLSLKYRVYESVLVYRAGEELYRRLVQPAPTVSQIETSLHSILREVNATAVRDGILRDPFTRTVGQIDATDFYEAVDALERSSAPQTVSVVAAGDIYTEGPVRVVLNVSSQEDGP